MLVYLYQLTNFSILTKKIHCSSDLLMGTKNLITELQKVKVLLVSEMFDSTQTLLHQHYWCMLSYCIFLMQAFINQVVPFYRHFHLGQSIQEWTK